MFALEEHSRTSKLEPISVSDVFDDIKLTAGGANLEEQGYIPLTDETYKTPPHSLKLNLRYMVKPSQAVIEHMEKFGCGYPKRAIESIVSSISFAYAASQINVKTAGVVNPDELALFKENAELVGDCLVKTAYKKFHALHPNFYLRSCIPPNESQLSNIEQHARNLWIAVGFTLKNDAIIKEAEKGGFNKFYLNQARLDYLNKHFCIDVPTVHKDKRIDNDDSLTLG